MPISAACLFLLAAVTAGTRDVRLEFNDALHSRVLTSFDGKAAPFTEWAPSEFVTVAGADVKDFPMKNQRAEDVRDTFGKGRRQIVTGETASLRKEVRATSYEDYPAVIVLEVRYTNIGRAPVKIDRWTNNHYTVAARDQSEEPFWSFQSGSYEKRPSWVLPIKGGLQAGQLPGDERHRLRRGHAGRRHLAPRRRCCRRPPRTRAEAGFAPRYDARDRLGRTRGHLCLRQDARPRRVSGHLPHLRVGSQGRLLRHAARIPEDDDRTGREIHRSAARRLRADLVRLGLPSHIPAAPDLWRAADREEARVPLGHARRRLADLRRGLVPRAEEVPERRPRHEGDGRPDPHRRLQGAALVGADVRRPGHAEDREARRLAAPQQGRQPSEDLVLGRVLPLPGGARSARRCGRLRDQGDQGLGLRRASSWTAST